MTANLLMLSITIAAPALKDWTTPVPTIVGEWAVENVTVNAQMTQPSSDRWVFTANGSQSIHAGGKVIVSGSYFSDRKTDPPSLDIVREPGKGPSNLCVFHLDGDTLTLSVGHDRNVRPADLRPGQKVTVWVFKRIHPKE